MEYQHHEVGVLPNKLGGGPHGIGDPNDKTLRRVEKEILIPKIMRERAKLEKCVDEVKQFEICCRDNSLLMVVNCRKQNTSMKSCFNIWYKNAEFNKECTNLYLTERTEFRKTGIPKKNRT